MVFFLIDLPHMSHKNRYIYALQGEELIYLNLAIKAQSTLTADVKGKIIGHYNKLYGTAIKFKDSEFYSFTGATKL